MSAKLLSSLAFSILFIFPLVFCLPTNVKIPEIKQISEKSESEVITFDDLEIFNNSSNFSYPSVENPGQRKVEKDHKNYPLLVSVLSISFLIILINARVFYIVTSENRQKSRSVNIFVAHLSSNAIAFTFVLLIYALEKSNIFSVTAPGLCETLSFLRHGLLCVFPLNAVAIIYVRLTSTSGRLFVIRSISLIWSVALIGSFPSFFMVKYSKDIVTQREHCEQIPIFGSYELTLTYEVFRFFTFHLVECFYMAFALCQIRSKIKYLYILKPIPNDRTKKKVQRVRYIYVHSIIFILIWFPTGVAIGIYKVLCRKGEVDASIKNYLIPLIFLSTSLYILSPLIYLLLHEDMSDVNFWEFALCSRNRSQIQENDYENTSHGNENCKEEKNNQSENNVKKEKERNKLHEITDLSRISTVNISQSVVLPQSSTLQRDQQPHSSRIELPESQNNSDRELETNDCVFEEEAESKEFGKKTSV